MNSDIVAQLCGRIGPLDAAAMAAAQHRLDRLTKPQGSLGRLEEVAVRLAGITGQAVPSLGEKVVLVLAADHGVAAEGVSAYPAEVTAQMVRNFLAGGAAISVLARHAGCRVVVADLGVDADFSALRDLVHSKVARGTANLAAAPAMSRRQALMAIAHGAGLAQSLVGEGVGIIGLGEMGIGNSTAASALVAAFTGLPAEQVTGRGTGLAQGKWSHKAEVVKKALALHQLDPSDPVGVLAAVGGFEIAGLVGAALACAASRVAAMVDGFISASAALVACELCPSARPYLIASHLSTEPGHRAILERLEMAPLLALDMRLGEGTGAALGIMVVEAALRLLREMATFEEAGVSERDERPESRDERRVTEGRRERKNGESPNSGRAPGLGDIRRGSAGPCWSVSGRS